jgi:hypothetical protein
MAQNLIRKSFQHLSGRISCHPEVRRGQTPKVGDRIPHEGDIRIAVEDATAGQDAKQRQRHASGKVSFHSTPRKDMDCSRIAAARMDRIPLPDSQRN